MLLPTTLTLVGLAACGAAVMSNVDNVTTTTNNKIVDSANSAVSIGRWSNLASIAFSFHSLSGKVAKTPLLRLRLRGFSVYLGLG
jgi:hypothetical protein